MPMPVRSLPVVQNWDCQGCSDCCRTYHVRVSDAERERIAAQGWGTDPDLKGVELFVHDRKAGGHRLNHRDDGACVFLGPDNRCRIHGKFGSAAKPMACRVYPFVLVPAGDHWRVGMRFACPAAVANHGRPMTEQAADARAFAGLLEADAGGPAVHAPPPELQPGQAVEWPDLLRFVKAINGLLANPAEPVEFKLRKVLALTAVCRKAKFDAVKGGRLTEFLNVMAAAVGEDIPAKPEGVPRPGWVGRMLFRQVLALYARKDVGLNMGEMAARGPLGRVVAAWRFGRGKGRVPKVHAFIPDTTFEAAERPAGPLPPESEKLLSRYLQVKAESLQFCGPTNFRRTFWDGLETLALTVPATLWLARVLAADGRPRAAAIAAALRIVDDNFGFSKLLGSGRQLAAQQAMGLKGEVPRLVAWYAR